MFEVNIYLETSLKGPGKRKGWYAAVLEYHTKKQEVKTLEIFGQESEITYHKSALLAFLKALKRLNKDCILTVFTDSLYLGSNFEKNLLHWEENGFRNAKGEDIKNKEEWQQISELSKRHKVTFVRVKRHQYSLWMMEEAQKRMEENNSQKNVDNFVENTENIYGKEKKQNGIP